MAQQRIIILVAVVLAIAGLIALSVTSCDGGRGGSTSKTGAAGDGGSGTSDVPGMPQYERVVIGKHEFNLELALDDASRARGLMHRDHIDEHGGMLFVFPDSKVTRQSFWMKNCLVDMDIIYLDRSGRVTATHRMKAQPPQRADESDAVYEARMSRSAYPSGYPAQFAIELRSGWLDQLNLKVEDRIELDVSRLKALAK
jgi:uncharacterized membrane protein (UPF0127 family)